MFSIWEHRYSYGICFSAVYALQNSTPNISTPNILSVHTRRVEIGHILCMLSWLYIYRQNSFQIVSRGTVEWNLWTCETSLNNPYDLLLNFFRKERQFVTVFPGRCFSRIALSTTSWIKFGYSIFPKIVCSLYCKFSAPLRRTWVGFVGVHS